MRWGRLGWGCEWRRAHCVLYEQPSFSWMVTSPLVIAASSTTIGSWPSINIASSVTTTRRGSVDVPPPPAAAPNRLAL